MLRMRQQENGAGGMESKLKLVVENNLEFLKQENFDSTLRAGKLRIKCRHKCGWQDTTIGEQMDSPGCPRCGR